MANADQILCLFTATIEERDGSYVIEIPERELDIGGINPDNAYRFAVLPSATDVVTETEDGTTRSEGGDRPTRQVTSGPPVEEGDRLDVEIQDFGEKGDGIARVDRGFIIFVPGTRIGDVVTIEVTSVQETFAVGEVVNENAIMP